jgi:putative hydrolase of the HAD superfamily
VRAIDAILFDADGVIQRAPPDIHVRLATALGAAPIDLRACIEDVWTAEAPALTGAADFAHALGPVLAKWGAHGDAAAFLAAWLVIDADHSILELVAELRWQGVVCALASNQEAHRARHMSEALAYERVFDQQFYSCHLGWAKPTPEYFAEVLRRGRFDPARTLFIDDRPANVAAAREAGLAAEEFVLGDIGQGAEPMRALLARYGL